MKLGCFPSQCPVLRYANDGYADDEHAADDGHEPRPNSGSA